MLSEIFPVDSYLSAATSYSLPSPSDPSSTRTCRHPSDRQDSGGSGYDSPRSSSSGGRDLDHVMAKHRAMAQQQTPLGRRGGEERVGRTRRDSFSVSFDWLSLPSSHSSTHSAPCSTVASPLAVNSHHDDGEEVGVDRKWKRDTVSTLVSLPLAFPEHGDNLPDSSLMDFPSHAGFKGEEEHEESGGLGAESFTSTPVPSHHHRARGQQLSASDGFRLGSAGIKATPSKRERGGKYVCVKRFGHSHHVQYIHTRWRKQLRCISYPRMARYYITLEYV